MSKMKQIAIRLDENHMSAIDRYRQLARTQMGYEPTQAQAAKALFALGAQRFQPPAPVKQEETPSVEELDDAEA